MPWCMQTSTSTHSNQVKFESMLDFFSRSSVSLNRSSFNCIEGRGCRWPFTVDVGLATTRLNPAGKDRTGKMNWRPHYNQRHQ
jgi:hypothetical protein